MAPRTRLIWLVAATAVPLTAMAAFWPSLVPVVAVVLGAVVAGSVIDAVAAMGTFDGVTARCGESMRLTKDACGSIELLLIDERSRPLHLRVALSLPPEIVCPEHEINVSLLPARGRPGHRPLTDRMRPMGGPPTAANASWPCTPVRRGRFVLEHVYMEAPSPLGLWAVRKALPVRVELRVYPNLAGERRCVAALFLRRGGLGVHAQRQIGQGRDFEKLRRYIPGDSYADVHWKATAKRGRPITKVYQIERTQEVYVVLDSSRLAGRAIAAPATAPVPEDVEARDYAGTTNMLERFVSASLVLALAAERQGDLFGMLTFSDRVDRFVRAKGGRSHYRACRDALYTIQPTVVSPDYGELVSFVRTRLRRRALLVILTNLDDPILAEQFSQHVQVISRQHLVLASMLKTPAAAPLFSSGADNVDDIYHRLGAHMQWRRLCELERSLRHRGVGFHLLDNETMSSQLVSQYVSVKQRQLL